MPNVKLMYANNTPCNFQNINVGIKLVYFSVIELQSLQETSSNETTLNKGERRRYCLFDQSLFTYL